MDVPADYEDLFEKKTFAHFATTLPDGRPHVTPVWVDYDSDANELLINTARGRRKTRNVQSDPVVGISMVDPDNQYRSLSVTGTVTEITPDGAVEHINALAGRYMGVEEYPNLDSSNERLILRIHPDEVRALEA